MSGFGRAKSPKPLKLVAVDEELALKDSGMTVNLYHVAGNPHADTLLMAHFPRERILVEVDAFTPGSAVQPYAANLRENISRRALKVDRIVPLHGAIAPYSELPPQAIARLGIAPGQTNLLVRVTLRQPTRTLTDEDANRLRNAIYAAIHEGSAHAWAAS